jgi:hypothetical protein
MNLTGAALRSGSLDSKEIGTRVIFKERKVFNVSGQSIYTFMSRNLNQFENRNSHLARRSGRVQSPLRIL